MNTRKCPDCGIQMEMSNIRGMPMPWKEHRDVPLPIDLIVPQCPQCKEAIINGRQCEEIDIAMAKLLEPKVKLGTTICVHGTPTDQTCPLC